MFALLTHFSKVGGWNIKWINSVLCWTFLGIIHNIMRQNIKYHYMIHCAIIIKHCWEHVIVLSRSGCYDHSHWGILILSSVPLIFISRRSLEPPMIPSPSQNLLKHSFYMLHSSQTWGVQIHININYNTGCEQTYSSSDVWACSRIL